MTTTENCEKSEIIHAIEFLDRIDKGENIHYLNVTIEGDLNLSNLSKQKDDNNEFLILSSIKIVNSTINGIVDFGDINFKHSINFKNTKFIKDFNIKGCKFYRNATFKNVYFNKNANFSNSQFCGNSNFRNIYFKKNANFRRASFIKGANFKGAKFGGDVHFERSEFKDYTYFRGANFISGAHFNKTQFDENVDFKGTRFSIFADFCHSRFNGHANFNNITFNGSVYFKESKFLGDADFRDTRFREYAVFWKAFFNKNLYLEKAELKYFHIKWDSIKNHLDYDTAVYLALIKNFQTLDTDDADNCYYQYRKKTLKLRKEQNTRLFNLSIFYDYLSWLSCGYGVRPVYTIYFSVLSIFFFAIIFWIINFNIDFNLNDITWLNLNNLFLELFFSFFNALYLSSKVFIQGGWDKLNGINSFIALVEIFVKWIISALFISVLARKLIKNI